METSTHTRAVERTAWWLRSEMGLRDAADPPVPGPLKSRARLDLHGIGHARAATTSRFVGALLATTAALALLFGARTESNAADDPGHPIATAVGAGLGALSVAGFIAGRVIEQRTRYHVWLQCETRAVSAADVQNLLDAVDEVKDRSDRAWSPDQAWLVASSFNADATSLARANGVRCFVRDKDATREV